VWKCCLVDDFEDFNFFELEIHRTRENRLPVQSGIVNVNISGAIKISQIVGVCVAVIGNTNVTKVWTQSGMTKDCPVLLFGIQRKSSRRDVVRILQREKKTFLTVIHLHAINIIKNGLRFERFPLQRSETSENVPFRV
jgi:hypothetical protein